MKLLVLAGGFGTRLKSVVNDVPKALAPINNIPFLLLQLQQWQAQGITSFVFLLHHQADLIIEFLQQQQQSDTLKGCKVEWVVEPEPLDTGGAVAYAVQQLRLEGDFFVANADTWLGTGIEQLGREPSPAMAVVELKDAARYGQIEFNEQYQITAFREKDRSVGSGWINAGLCKLNANLFDTGDIEPSSLEKDIYPHMVAKRELRAVPLHTDFIDIGVPDDYYRFCRWVASGRKGSLCI